MTLEEYLSTEYEANRADILALEQALRESSQTFRRSFRTLQEELGYWDYDLRPDRQPPLVSLKNVSHGTVAMVLAALGKIIGYDRSTNDSAPLVPDDGSELATRWRKGAATLAAAIAENKCINSSSFGKNDPITLCHIAEALRIYGDPATADMALRVESTAMAQVRALLDGTSGNQNLLAPLRKLLKDGPIRNEAMLPIKPDKKAYLVNAFVPLRVVRAHRLLRDAVVVAEDFVTSPDFRNFFESTIHNQLSFSSIQDSRFDPAELMYSLEGLALLAPTSIDTHLFERILEVLEAKQKESAHWRPSKPIYATPHGMTMLPISVEGVNSLLRSFMRLCDLRPAEFAGFGTRCVGMMRRFWQWLRTRAVVFPDYTGWHSEHVNDRQLVHTWDTSQVIEFMLGYRALLERDIAHRTLVLSRVKAREPRKSDGWEKVETKWEATTSLGTHYRIYRQLGEQFVAPRTAGPGKKSYSALLYGPPGTGKTSLVKNLADALSKRLLSLSVSDFLGEGGAMVEARAKAIFKMLEAQRGCVIFFDEIDSFLLDRNSDHYRRQDTLFQFLTPGMLTKINDLRESERVIFLIAANYENRIDPAIKRPGRIDQKYLLLPPDRSKRLAILEERGVPDAVAKDEAVLQASLFMGYSEITAAVGRAGVAGSDANGLAAALKQVGASTGPEAYGQRVFIETTYPYEEAACLYLLAKEVGQDLEFKEGFETAAEKAAAPAASQDKRNERIEAVWTDISAQAARIVSMAATEETT